MVFYQNSPKFKGHVRHVHENPEMSHKSHGNPHGNPHGNLSMSHHGTGCICPLAGPIMAPNDPQEPQGPATGPLGPLGAPIITGACAPGTVLVHGFWFISS